jgi:Double zinc ribbon/WD domain, G-beta repeat
MRCSKCGFEVPAGAKFCRNCGAALPRTLSQPSQAGPQQPSAVSAARLQRCPSCGAEVPAGKKFCRSCGAPLGAPLPAPRPTGPSAISQTGRAAVKAARSAVGSRAVRLAVGIPVLVAVLALAFWRFMPRKLLPPEKVGTILDRATAGSWVTFNDGAPGRRTLALSTGTDLWELPSGRSLEPGMNVGFVLSPDGESFLGHDMLSLFNWRSKNEVPLPHRSPQWVADATGRRFPNSFTGILRFSDDGALLAAVRADGSIYLLSPATGQVIHTLREGSNEIMSDTAGPAGCAAASLGFSLNGKVLASGENNGDVTLWNTVTGDELKVLRKGSSQPCEASSPQPLDPSNAVSTVGFSPDGQLLATEDGYGIVRIWQRRSGKLLHVLPAHFQRPFQKAEFSPDGRFLVTAGESVYAIGEIYLVWNAASGRLLQALSFPGYGAFDFAPNGDLLIAQLGTGRVKVVEWALRSRFRLPFVSSAQDTVAHSDSAVIEAYENSATQHLNFLEDSLGKYMGGKGKGSFPRSLQDISKGMVAGKGMFQDKLFGYDFLYKPGPADENGDITTFALSARPLLYKQTGTRSFRVDQTGQAFATEEDREATTTDSGVSGLTNAMQVAETARNAARQEVEAHLTRAQMLFQQRQFQAAIAECDAALSADPLNQEAARLKSQIQQTMSILGAGPEAAMPLPAPVQLAPSNGATFDIFPRTTTLMWQAVPGAASYGVEVDFTDLKNGWYSAFKGKPWLVRTGITSNQFVFNFVGAQPGRWRVWAVGANGQAGERSGWWEFRYTR